MDNEDDQRKSIKSEILWTRYKETTYYSVNK